jgi:hypothetical protein
MPDTSAREQLFITVGGVKYPLLYGVFGQFKASQFGLDTRDINVTMRDEARSFATFIILMAAGIAHTFHAKGERILTPEDVALRIKTEEYVPACATIVRELQRPDAWTVPHDVQLDTVEPAARLRLN